MYSIIFSVILLHLTADSKAHGRDGTLSALPETIFGEKTFLPEAIPTLVRRTTLDDGDIRLTIDLLYSENTHIRWYASNSRESFMGEKRLKVNQRVPILYSLNLTLPVDFILGEDTEDEIFEDINGDFIVDQNELFIKFETGIYSEAAALRISLDTDNFHEDEHEDNIFQESIPHFPQMEEIQRDILVVNNGQRARVEVPVAFTENDRFTVRSIIYNATSKRIFASDWSTSYLLGPSHFSKTYMVDDETDENFDDNVMLEDSLSSSELKRIIIDLPTQNNDISGIVKITGHSEINAAASDFILESSLEQTITIVREGQEHGPLKAELLDFVGGNYGQHYCIIGSSCVVSCEVLGVYVDDLKLKHKDLASDFVDLPEKHVDIGTYESVVNVAVNSSDPSFSGTYLCVATRGHVIIDKEIDVFFLREN